MNRVLHKYKHKNKQKHMNITQIIASQFIALVSLTTLAGVLIHDVNIDKAFKTATYKQSAKDVHTTDTSAHMRPGTTPHTHAEHLKVGNDRVDQAKALPRRDRKKVVQQVIRGHHGDGICMPLAGEWV